MEIQEIVTTGTRSQELLYSVVKEHADLATREIETISGFNNIAKQLAHCIGAEERWQARLLHESADKRYEATASPDILKLHSDWLTARKQTVSIMADGGELITKHIFEVHLAVSDIHVPMTGEEIVYQIIAHENYHRGQCSYLLQIFGVDPPNFDFPLMISR
jgi:uncharacterized damage-inducible protein DinB